MTNYTVFFQKAAVEDVKTITEWYELQTTGLGERFENDVDGCLKKVIKYPENYPFHRGFGTIRKIQLKIFPYYIFFLLDGTFIQILGVIHTSRSDQFVKKRLR